MAVFPYFLPLTVAVVVALPGFHICPMATLVSFFWRP
jgi:hypothetical protein